MASDFTRVLGLNVYTFSDKRQKQWKLEFFTLIFSSCQYDRHACWFFFQGRKGWRWLLPCSFVQYVVEYGGAATPVWKTTSSTGMWTATECFQMPFCQCVGGAAYKDALDWRGATIQGEIIEAICVCVSVCGAPCAQSAAWSVFVYQNECLFILTSDVWITRAPHNIRLIVFKAI